MSAPMQLQALYVYGVFNVTNAIGNYAIIYVRS